jgi:hypothetical protein
MTGLLHQGKLAPLPRLCSPHRSPSSTRLCLARDTKSRRLYTFPPTSHVFVSRVCFISIKCGRSCCHLPHSCTNFPYHIFRRLLNISYNCNRDYSQLSIMANDNDVPLIVSFGVLTIFITIAGLHYRDSLCCFACRTLSAAWSHGQYVIFQV